MPPVLGPVSPSPSRLWSWAAGSRSSCAPSVRANTDSSSPFKKSSMTISRPASPNAASASIARAARTASVRRAHTTAPFPAARPDAVTTGGSAGRLMYARAGSSAVKVWLAAVAIRARRITSFANALDDSMRAAAALGPNTACPASRRASASPAASGPSGPTMVKSIWCSRAAATSSAVAPADSGRVVPSWAVLRVGPAAGVLAAQHAIVVTLLDPALQLGGAHRVERMRATQHSEDLEDAVEGAAGFLVLFRLHEERVQVHLRHVAAPCELE